MMLIRLRMQGNNVIFNNLVNGKYTIYAWGGGCRLDSTYNAIMQAIAGLFHIGLSVGRVRVLCLFVVCPHLASCFVQAADGACHAVSRGRICSESGEIQ